MKYTQYFKEHLNIHHSEMNLNNKQLLRLLNIVTLEAAIMGNLENGIKLDTGQYRYRRTKTLNELTKRLRPEVLYSQMIELSKKTVR